MPEQTISLKTVIEDADKCIAALQELVVNYPHCHEYKDRLALLQQARADLVAKIGRKQDA